MDIKVQNFAPDSDTIIVVVSHAGEPDVEVVVCGSFADGTTMYTGTTVTVRTADGDERKDYNSYELGAV